MYESFFALKEKPFSLTPNPRYLYLSKTHNEVYAHLVYGIENRAGFVEVTGEVGTGKTTILRTLLVNLDESKYRVAFIFNPKLTAFELLRNINREFGVAEDGGSSSELVHALNSFLLAENQAGRTPILVIDEAQNLSGEVLEQIRLLSNLETADDKLIQVILVGQPELRHHLSDYSLRQLSQRIAVRYQLRPLNREETRAYILHRLKIAGRPDGNVFSPAAISEVYRASGGVPRKVNLVCDRALLTAFTEERSVVTPRDVRQAIRELAGMGEGEKRASLPRWVMPVIAVLVLVLIAGLYRSRLLEIATDKPVVAETPVPVPAPNAAPAQAPAPVKESLHPLIASCNAMLALWDKPLLPRETRADGLDIDKEFTARGFELVRLQGAFSDLRLLNLPMLLPIREEQGGGYLAVLGKLESGNWKIAPARSGRDELSSAEIDALGIQVAVVPWIDFASIGYVAVPGVAGENVRRLQFLLGLAGCKDVPTSGRYDAASIKCVKDFQRTHGLVVDGLVGPRTLAILYQTAGAYAMPRLS